MGSQSAGEVEADSASVERDRELVAAILGKNRKSAAQLIARYTDTVYRYVHYRLVPRSDLVDDVVQDVFLAAWDNLDKYQGKSSLKTWLMGIARHKVEDYYRLQLRHHQVFDSDEDADPGILDAPEFEMELDRQRAIEQAREVLTDLPESYRLLLFWRYWEKRSLREIAVAVDKTEKAVERALARARSQFKWRWEHGQDPKTGR